MATNVKLPTPREIKKLAQKHGNHPSGRFNARDEGLIAGAGFAHWTLTDLSLIKVQDLISESGQLLREGYLPESYSSSNKERLFVIGNGTYFEAALLGVIQWRIAQRIELLDRKLFAGLNPESNFFLQDNGRPFEISYKARDNKPALLDPYQLRRHFQKFYLGEGLSYQTLNDAFIMNYWLARSSYGTAMANNDLMELTGLHINTIRQKCAREEKSIQDILETLYR